MHRFPDEKLEKSGKIMKNIIIVALTVLGVSLSTTVYADQSEDQVALTELEKDFLALFNEPKQKKQKKKHTSNTDDEPDCD